LEAGDISAVARPEKTRQGLKPGLVPVDAIVDEPLQGLKKPDRD